jgi:hypothetical protein
MYDEVEYFKKYTHPEFYYPFQKRKTKMGTFTLDITLDKDTYDYDYYSKTVSFQQSQVCLESNPMALHEDFYYSSQESIENFEWSQVNYGGWAQGLTKAFGGDESKFEEQES